MIIHLIDGTYELFRHFYGHGSFNKAKDKLKELLDAEGELDRLAIIHTQNEAGAREFMEEHKASMPKYTIITEVGPTLGTHIGLNSIGFVSVRK